MTKASTNELSYCRFAANYVEAPIFRSPLAPFPDGIPRLPIQYSSRADQPANG